MSPLPPPPPIHKIKTHRIWTNCMAGPGEAGGCSSTLQRPSSCEPELSNVDLCYIAFGTYIVLIFEYAFMCCAINEYNLI